LPKPFCGRVHCPVERSFIFSFANWVFSHEFFRLVWLKDWNNIPRLLFYSFQDNQLINAFSIPKHRCHELSCWWNRPCFLWRWTTGFCPLLWLLFGFWCVMVNPCLIHSNKSTYIIIYQSKRSNILIMTEYSNIQNFKFCCLTQYFPRRIWEVNLKANRDAKLGSTWQYLAVLGSTW